MSSLLLEREIYGFDHNRKDPPSCCLCLPPNNSQARQRESFPIFAIQVEHEGNLVTYKFSLGSCPLLLQSSLGLCEENCVNSHTGKIISDE